MRDQRFDPLHPEGADVFTFDFTSGLATDEILTGPAVVKLEVDEASAVIDPTPNQIQNGLPTIDSTQKLVLMPLKGGIKNADYLVTIKCYTSNPLKVLVHDVVLPMRI